MGAHLPSVPRREAVNRAPRSRCEAAALRLRAACSAPAWKRLRRLAAAAAAHCGGGAVRGSDRRAPRPPALPAHPHCGAAAYASRPAQGWRGSTGHALCGGLWPLKLLRRRGRQGRGPALTTHTPRSTVLSRGTMARLSAPQIKSSLPKPRPHSYRPPPAWRKGAAENSVGSRSFPRSGPSL